MPLAFPLAILLMAVLFGCTPSARSLFAAPADSRPVETTAAALSCGGRLTKGLAEVVEINASQVWLRFYPGDQLFAWSRADSMMFGAQVGDELRAVRRDATSGPCERVRFEIVDGALIGPSAEEIGGSGA